MTTKKCFGSPSKDAHRFTKNFTSPYDLQHIKSAFYSLRVQRRAPIKSWGARSLAVAIILNGFPDEVERKLLDIWEKIAFRIFGLCREDARKKRKVFCQLVREILKKDLNPDDISQSIHRIGTSYIFDMEEEDIYDIDRYTGWQDELRYLLCCYEKHLAQKSNRPLSNEKWECIYKYSIEHILPQTTGSRLIHALGNLMLLPRGLNSKLRDKNPQHKAAAYRQTKLFSAIEVADWIDEYSGTESGYEDWHEPCIVTRTITLLDWIDAEFCRV